MRANVSLEAGDESNPARSVNKKNQEKVNRNLPDYGSSSFGAKLDSLGRRLKFQRILQFFGQVVPLL